MFFDSTNFNISIISSFEIHRNELNNTSGNRPHHTLSFRLLGNSSFIHEAGNMNVTSGDIVFLPAHFQYKIVSDKEYLFIIHFTSDSILSNTIKKFSVPAQYIEYIRNNFSKFHQIWIKKESGYEYECKSVFYKILTKIEKYSTQAKLTQKNDMFADAVDYIHDNFITENISVEQLSKSCYMSSTYFRKLFIKKFNTTPQKYINKLKLQYAVELLKSGYYSISEVSDICHFQNVYYFSAFIKKETGLPPSKIQSSKIFI